MMHAAYCVGCCKAMMVLVVVGLMNLLDGDSVRAVLRRKNWKHGRGRERRRHRSNGAWRCHRRWHAVHDYFDSIAHREHR